MFNDEFKITDNTQVVIAFIKMKDSNEYNAILHGDSKDILHSIAHLIKKLSDITGVKSGVLCTSIVTEVINL